MNIKYPRRNSGTSNQFKIALIASLVLIFQLFTLPNQANATSISTPDIWVPNNNDNTATELNTSGSLLGTFNAGGGPIGVAIDSYGDAWVTNSTDNTISKFNSSGSLIGTFSVGGSPFGVAIDGHGNAWVANSNDNTVTELDRSGSLVGTFNVGGAPVGVAIDASDNVWVVNNGDGTVTELNSSGSLLGTFSVGGVPFGVAIDAFGNAWVANNADSTVTKLNSSGGLVGTFNVGGGPIGVAIDGSGNVWVANSADSTVTELNSSGSLVGTFDVGGGPIGISIDGSGNVWVANSFDSTVTELNSSGSSLGTYNVGGSPYGFGDMTGFALQKFVLGYVNWSASCGSYSVTGSDGLIYGTVLGADGKCWLDRNLGATEVANSLTDYNAYGSLFQWGRGADGHQLVTYTDSTGDYSSISGTTTTPSSTVNPGNDLFITPASGDWLGTGSPNDTLWQGTSGTNNPCPTDFRLPTDSEWSTLVSAAGITNDATAFSSTLKLSDAGIRDPSSAGLFYQGVFGGYWSSSVTDPQAAGLLFSSVGISFPSVVRAYGVSVRCVSDDTVFGASIPVVTTGSASSVSDTSFILNGNITDTGGIVPTIRGFAYSTDATLNTVIATTTESGSFGADAFTDFIFGLSCNTKYYFRAYATNSVGTGFGSIASSTTSACSLSSPTIKFQNGSIKFLNGSIKVL